MGKSNSKKQRKEEALLLKQQREQQQKAAEQRLNRIGAIVTGAAVLVIVLIVGAYFAINALLDNGYFLRRNTALTSQSYEINNAQFSYFLYEEYRDFINENYEQLSDMGLEAEKSLKKQKSYFGDGTWYEHFSSLASKNLAKTLSLCEASKENGVSLNDADKKEIDYIIDEMKADASGTNRSETEYFGYMYGRGVTEKDVRACLEIELLAKKYKDTLYDSFEITDKEYKQIYNAAPEKYSVASVFKYTIKNEEFYNNLNDKSSLKEIEDALYSDIIKDYKENYDTELNRDLIDMLVISNMTGTYSFGDDEIIDSFAFKKSAKKDDFRLEKNDEGCTVYIIKEDISVNDEATANIKVIYSSNNSYGGEEYANNFLTDLSEEIEEGEDISSRFATAASLYSEDLETKANFGVMNNVSAASLESSVSEWVFTEGRKKGDTEIISGNEGQYLVLYESEGLPAYKANILKEKFSEYFEALTKEFEAKYSTNINSKNIKKISL